MIRRILLVAALFGAGCHSAVADPRQDMLAGISRCAGLSDDRTFLDCVYGAAQPMRAELGLQPAPSFQTRLVPPAPGARAVLPPSTTSVPPPMAASAPPRQKTDGIFGGLFDGGTAQTARMASYLFNPHGLFTVTLSNGQVWRQMNNDSKRAHWRAPAPNYSVAVKEGIFGASLLEVDGDQTQYIVQRLR